MNTTGSLFTNTGGDIVTAGGLSGGVLSGGGSTSSSDHGISALDHLSSTSPWNSQYQRTTSHYLNSSLGGNLGVDMTKLASKIATTTTTTSTTTTSTNMPALSTNTAANQSNFSQLNSQQSGGQSNSVLRQLMDDMRQIEDTVDSIEIPARGRCKVFMAKYGYDPFKQSPNENPDAELAFNAGDYIMVFDDLDEDGYFIGELMDGRRGYVPSNWLDRLTGEDLFEFQANVLYKQPLGCDGASHGGVGGSNSKQASTTGMNLGGSSLASSLGGGVVQTSILGQTGSISNAQQQFLNNELFLTGDDLVLGNDGVQNYPPDYYDSLLQDPSNQANFKRFLAPEDYHRMNDYVDLDDVNEVDDECLSDYERAEAEQMRRAVPPPQRLMLERQLNKCILISWLHPQTAKGLIVSYQVYVDGVLKSTVPSGDRTKALLEGVDSNIPHRISVRAIDVNGRHSNDAGCTIVIGARVPFAPSCVKASHITSDSALISWLPCNSNFHHVVAVNSVEVQTVRPGVYKHLINGLSANTLYRVWVRAKPGKILSIDEKNPKKLESLTTFVDFKTMPKSLPDPPVNVQVEAGPQRRTLLVTWLPLTLNDYGGSSNGCPVTGYAVFAGHKKLADIDSPTGDHALLDLADLESLHKKSVTVRTKSGENLSQDSMPCHIPDEYLKSAILAPTLASARHSDQHHHHHHHSSSNQHASHHAHHSASHQTNVKAHHRLSSESNATNSSQRGLATQRHHGASVGPRARPLMTRSMQNLDSDLDSRRSSLLPAIEVTRGSDQNKGFHTESYSEEEFESSMRLRGHNRAGGGRTSTSGARSQQHSPRYQRARGHQAPIGNSGAFSSASRMNAHHQQRLVGANLAASGNSVPAGEMRYFVALFDYDPLTMSPNPNAAADELAFKEGSIIKIYGPLGEDGFYRGELDNNQIGYVPCNVITEITDPNLLQSLYASEQGPANQRIVPTAPTMHIGAGNTYSNQDSIELAGGGVSGPLQAQGQQQQTQMQQAQQQGGVKRMVALYDYDPQENSPNADTESEIPFKTGDIIYVYGKMDTDGFYMGEVERTKQRGLVPSNFLREDTQQASARIPIGQQAPFGLAGTQQSMNPLNQQQQQQPQQMQAMAIQQQQQQQPQQQHMRGMNQPQIRGPNNLIGNQQQQVAQQQQQQSLHQQPNINRPNTLSLGGQHQMGVMANQGQQVGTHMQTNISLQQGNSSGNFIGANMQQQQNRMGNMMGPNTIGGQQPSNMNMSQQQQQQANSGVLSSLLSSGKQIIGVATTPRAPNPMSNQFGGANFSAGMNQIGGQQQQPQQQQMQNQQTVGGLGGQQMQNVIDNQMANFNQMRSADLMGNSFGPQQQQQQQQQLPGQQQPSMYNQLSASMRGNLGMNGGGGPGLGMGAHSMMANHQGPQNMGPSGDDQGGNILNTVKNMFKL